MCDNKALTSHKPCFAQILTSHVAPKRLYFEDSNFLYVVATETMGAPGLRWCLKECGSLAPRCFNAIRKRLRVILPAFLPKFCKRKRPADTIKRIKVIGSQCGSATMVSHY